MNFEELFKPYSPEIRGDLENYLRHCEEGCVDTLFHGSKYFFEIRDKGFIIPEITYIPELG